MRVGFAQFNPIFGKRDQNAAKALSLMENADAELMVLPELFDTGYLFQSKEETLELASPVPDSSAVKELKRFSADKKMAVVAGIAEREGDKAYNSAITVLPDGSLHKYRKYHLFYKEKIHFEPGKLPIEIVHYKDARIGMMICFDWIFPEMCRLLTLKGANIICHPSNLVLPYCQKAMVTRCLENRVFSITCNRIGKEKRSGEEFKFTGMSRIVTPEGRVLCEGSKVKEQVEVVDTDLKMADNKKVTAYNHVIDDRRTDIY